MAATRWTNARASGILFPGEIRRDLPSPLSNPGESGQSSEEMFVTMRLIRAFLLVLAAGGISSSVLAQTPPPAQTKPESPPRAAAAATASQAPEPGGEVKAVTQAILEEIDKRS